MSASVPTLGEHARGFSVCGNAVTVYMGAWNYVLEFADEREHDLYIEDEAGMMHLQPQMGLAIFREEYVKPVDKGNWRPAHPEQHLMTHYGIFEAVEAMGSTELF